jgi:hypothetical protein
MLAIPELLGYIVASVAPKSLTGRGEKRALPEEIPGQSALRLPP